MYFKPNDTHALLHKNVFHPFRGALFGALRKRGYSCTFLRSIKMDVERGAECEEWITRVEKNKNLVRLVTNFSSAFECRMCTKAVYRTNTKYIVVLTATTSLSHQ